MHKLWDAVGNAQGAVVRCMGGWVALQQHRPGKKKCPLETPYFQHMKADGPKQTNQLHKAIDHKVKWHGCQGTYCVQI